VKEIELEDSKKYDAPRKSKFQTTLFYLGVALLRKNYCFSFQTNVLDLYRNEIFNKNFFALTLFRNVKALASHLLSGSKGLWAKAKPVGCGQHVMDLPSRPQNTQARLVLARS